MYRGIEWCNTYVLPIDCIEEYYQVPAYTYYAELTR